ncbi:RHS repeat-associated core domain-containing protein [Tahibacter amnicola]|uniref:RES domain-containing protein n=1 Tax=Tahibacter amnicola TaxID=2976241 RepID=A0ABY6BD76_9GAMM|nr:RHS repeat-associated core domain-containing protein [Tahibacter amnicola]UXI67070.1 RES domain-containing protein [Tahibacter amnicola]
MIARTVLKSTRLRLAHTWRRAFIAAALSLSVVALAQTDEPAVDAAESPIVRALLNGEDARALIAQAKAQATPGGDRPDTAERTAVGEYASALSQLRQRIDAARRGGSPNEAGKRHASLGDAIGQVRATGLLVQARMDALAHDVSSRRLPAVATERLRERSAAIHAYVQRLDQAVATLSTQLSASRALPDAVFAEVEALLASDHRDAPIYGAQLPTHRPRLAPREPALTPVIRPSYANADEEITPTADDLASTSDTPLGKEILAKAASLDYDYTRIHDFVRGQIRTEWYAGARKGAVGTLTSGAGNDVDQASLLIALLRASSAPARYVKGVLEWPVEDLAASLGVREDKVGQALTAAGIANSPVYNARITGYRIEQVYVSAYVPYSAYRGTTVDMSGKTWIPLAPALKPTRFTRARMALAAAQIDVRGFMDAYLQQSRTRSPFDTLRQQVSDFLAVQTPPRVYDEQLAQQAVDAPPLELLPASLPALTVAATGEFATLPDALRQRVRIVLRAGETADSPIVLDTTQPVADLVHRRVSITYQPASIDDGRITDSYGGMASTPPALYQVRPALMIQGSSRALGSGALDVGQSHRIDITVSGPAGTTEMSQVLTAGGLASLALNVGRENYDFEATNAFVAGDSEFPAARILGSAGKEYLSTWTKADNDLARLIGVGVVRPFPTAALLISQYRVDRVAGIVDRMEWRGVALDAALHPVEPFAHINSATAESDWMALSALHGSWLEHHQFEDMWHVDSISADKGLVLARAAGQTVETVTAATGTAMLNHPPAVIAAIQAWLSRGYVVDVPRQPVTYKAWTGSVWRVRSLSTGEAGYFISGGLAGGATALPPELWFVEDLAYLLGNPYSGGPNLNHNAGAVLSISSAAQSQEAEAGQPLARDLTALVLDIDGRPVKNAAVTFRVTSGGGKLTNADATDVAMIVARTDVAGRVAVKLKVGERISDIGRYKQEPAMAFPQWQGYNEVEVSAAAHVGTLVSGEPYRAYSNPAAPAAVKYDGSTTRRLAPSLGYLNFRARVVDRFDNPISNVPLSISATTTFTNYCLTEDGQKIDATLFASETPEVCPPGVLTLTGNACTLPAITMLSRPGGAAFNVVPPNVLGARVNVALAAAGASNSLSLATADDAFGCSDGGTVAVAWNYLPFNGYSFLLGDTSTILDAARPGELIPVPVRTDLFRRRIENGVTTWKPLVNATVRFNLTNGSGENFHAVGPGTYLFDLRAGPQPGPIYGDVTFSNGEEALELPARGRATGPNGEIVHGWSVDPAAPQVNPNPIALTPFNASDAPLTFTANFLPDGYYASPIRIELLKDGEPLSAAGAPIGGRLFGYRTPRGRIFEPNHRYSVRTVLNDGTPFRMQSAETTIRFGRTIVAGYGMISGEVNTTPAAPKAASTAASDPFAIIALLQNRFPKTLDMNQDLEVSTGTACVIGVRFGYVLSQPAKVSLSFEQLDGAGNASGQVAWQALQDVTLDEGLHDVLIDPARLSLGDFRYTLRAETAGGDVETYHGIASNRANTHEPLPLAHSFVKGVDVHSGEAVVTEADIVLRSPGVGPSLVRTYASHSGNKPGFFGRGWNVEMEGQVITSECGERIVLGQGGQGQRFAPMGNDTYRALHGYHGTLKGSGDAYDFWSKDGTHYRYDQADTRGPRLTKITDAKGYSVSFEWEMNQGQPRVRRITDGQRSIFLNYAVKRVDRQFAGITIVDLYTVVSSATGPDGLRASYEYDDLANLKRVVLQDGTGKGRRVTGYDYQDFGGTLISTPSGQAGYYVFGQRLTGVRDEIAVTERKYFYEMGWSGVFAGATGTQIQYLPAQRVIKIDDNTKVTGFKYEGVRGLEAVKTTVTDPRNAETQYFMNVRGAAERVVDAAGTTQTEWNMEHRQPAIVTDALQTTTEYRYDDFGNKTKETISHANGTLVREWRYWPPEQFGGTVKDRVRDYVDARALVTSYTYSNRGVRLTVERGGITETEVYGAGREPERRIDGNGKVWHLTYDDNGFPRTVRDPNGNTAETTFDVRGRKVKEVDGNGHATSWTYDARDRVLVTTYPAITAGVATESTTYLDAQRQRRVKNTRNYLTIYDEDAFGRVLFERVIDGERRFEYDDNGNMTLSTDYAGHETHYLYDAVNRLTDKNEPEGRHTHYEHDALGHVTQETVSAPGEEPRTTEYKYEDANYARTHVRRALQTPGGVQWLETVTRFDGNGNAERSVDALQRQTVRIFDARDRLESVTEPLGKVTTYTYDGADRKRTETRNNIGGSGAQKREWIYDDGGRLTQTIDAEGGHRFLGYDDGTNVTSRIDARGHVTTYVYDARNNLTDTIGPEAGQKTSYGYDLGGLRTSEKWANGREIVREYDARGRLKEARDAQGVLETYTYYADGMVWTQQDADGRTTINSYDDLNRLEKQTLPTADGLARIRQYTYTLGDEVATDTDPRSYVTTHTYDTVGRRVGTRYPAVDGVVAETSTAYDAVGNVIHETNARGQTTDYFVNALNQRYEQHDPPLPTGERLTQIWTHDTEGNVLTHQDRRGILSVTRYDRENRVVGRARDNRILETLLLDEEGNVEEHRDALNRLTTSIYDKANRRTSEQRPLGARRSWTYTPMNDVETVTDADYRTTTSTYTKRRFLETVTLAGETTRYTYDGMGHRRTMQRPKGEAYTWEYRYDDAGRLQYVIDPNRATTTFKYDASDNRTKIIDARTHTTTFAYDARNRLTGKIYPDNAAWTWKYDGDNNKTQTITPNQRTMIHVPDALNRLVETQYVDAPAGEVSKTAYTYDGNGNPRTITETTGTTTTTETRKYDPFDRLEYVDTNGRHHEYRYDAVGNRTHLIDHEGQATVWTFDELNRNTAIAIPGQGTTGQSHTLSGLLDTVTRPDGSTSVTKYDPAGRIESVTHSKANAAIARYGYRYDFNGNRIEQKESNGHLTMADEVTIYRYDDADRLKEIEEQGTTPRLTTYELDEVGNRVKEVVKVNNAIISDSTNVFDDRDQLTSRTDPTAGIAVTQNYDDNGNLKWQGSGTIARSYHYDARDRMVVLEQTGSPDLSFRYDSQGLRQEKSNGTQTTRYHYDQQSLLTETNAIGNPTRRYHYSAEQLLGETTVGAQETLRYYLLDALKSPIALLTKEGAVSARTSWDAFGEIRGQQGTNGQVTTPNREGARAELISTDEQPVGFTGYVKDSESGLYYAKARYMDPATARFTTEDPEAGKDMEPPSLHRYLYAYANPTVYTDPTGRCPGCSWRMSYANAESDEERERVLRKLANTDKTAGRTTGVALGLTAPIRSVRSVLSDYGSDDPSAQARMAARWQQLEAMNDEVRHAMLDGGVPGVAKWYFKGLGTRIGESAAKTVIAGDNGDYVGEGEAGTELAGIVAEAAGVAASAVAGVRGSTSALRVAEGGSGAPVGVPLRKVEPPTWEQRLAMNAENDFRGDDLSAGRSASTLGQTVDTTVYRFYDPHYPLMASNPRNKYRFSNPAARSTGGDAYFAGHASAAFGEVRQNTQGKNLFAGRLEGGNVLDLTNPDIAKAYGVDMKEIGRHATGPDYKEYGYPQSVGNRALSDGYSAIRYPSVQAPGSANIVIFDGKHQDFEMTPIFDVPDSQR